MLMMHLDFHHILTPFLVIFYQKRKLLPICIKLMIDIMFSLIHTALQCDFKAKVNDALQIYFGNTSQ